MLVSWKNSILQEMIGKTVIQLVCVRHSLPLGRCRSVNSKTITRCWRVNDEQQTWFSVRANNDFASVWFKAHGLIPQAVCVCTRTGSYGRCKNRCLIGVLHLAHGMFLVIFCIKCLLWSVEVHFDRAGSHKVCAVFWAACKFPSKVACVKCQSAFRLRRLAESVRRVACRQRNHSCQSLAPLANPS